MTPNQRPKILVPFDFSEPAQRALTWAVEYAGQRRSELHLLHVVEYHLADLFADNIPADDERLKGVAGKAQRKLEDVRVEKSTVYRHVAIGRPVHEILAVAAKLRPALIVIGSHGRTGLPGLLIGSVAEHVIRHARCPVVCVKH